MVCRFMPLGPTLMATDFATELAGSRGAERMRPIGRPHQTPPGTADRRTARPPACRTAAAVTSRHQVPLTTSDHQWPSGAFTRAEGLAMAMAPQCSPTRVGSALRASSARTACAPTNLGQARPGSRSKIQRRQACAGSRIAPDLPTLAPRVLLSLGQQGDGGPTRGVQICPVSNQSYRLRCWPWG